MTDPERWTEWNLRRASVVRIYECGERMVVLSPDGEGHALAGDSAMLAAAVLAFLEAPHTGAEVLAHVEALAGAPIERPEVIGELLGLLLRARALEAATVGAPARPTRAGGPRVVLGLTGAAATMHAPALIQRLQARGFEVRAAVTDSALRFVRAEALEALTHAPVVSAVWPESQVHRVPHIELAQWADAVLVCPASATTIARLATGDHASVVTAIALATRAPVLVVPSMNPAMYAEPAVQRNLARLVADGLHVAHPARALEVADPPATRTPMLGGSPPPEVVVQLLEAIVRERASATLSQAPRGAAGWDRLYRTHAAAELPWQREEADPDLLAALEHEGASGLAVLEVGAGLGALASAIAGRGHSVVATDISAAALEQARDRAPESRAIWLCDDITETRLRGRFDAAIDRACLHLLAGAEAGRYAAAMARLLRPGGVLIVKTLAEPAAGVTLYSREAIAALFAPAFALEREAASTLAGPAAAPAARLFVLRRMSE
ncbi:methyltransferase domain-containing protein [Nannocystis sp. ILAH1]|uniref:flavoprotein n=1 Tax=unclassified Nannocystis TaxID=2627009 RepID=UPI002271A45F|nr:MULTISPECIES: flavoprotein [unclassified Nannocystis]MCY0989586.1 methyltransferase domain-containing protein [Nannocystis sp. ILAH1]MCY1064795.1 methyltransferase domain-containing protein [Nannocystis sp. RBIL2]